MAMCESHPTYPTRDCRGCAEAYNMRAATVSAEWESLESEVRAKADLEWYTADLPNGRTMVLSMLRPHGGVWHDVGFEWDPADPVAARRAQASWRDTLWAALRLLEAQAA